MGESFIQATIIAKEVHDRQVEEPQLIALRVLGNQKELKKFFGVVQQSYEIKDSLRGDRQ